jgi:hypothetical protein
LQLNNIIMTLTSFKLPNFLELYQDAVCAVLFAMGAFYGITFGGLKGLWELASLFTSVEGLKILLYGEKTVKGKAKPSTINQVSAEDRSPPNRLPAAHASDDVSEEKSYADSAKEVEDQGYLHKPSDSPGPISHALGGNLSTEGTEGSERSVSPYTPRMYTEAERNGGVYGQPAKENAHKPLDNEAIQNYINSPSVFASANGARTEGIPPPLITAAVETGPQNSYREILSDGYRTAEENVSDAEGFVSAANTPTAKPALAGMPYAADIHVSTPRDLPTPTVDVSAFSPGTDGPPSSNNSTPAKSDITFATDTSVPATAEEYDYDSQPDTPSGSMDGSVKKDKRVKRLGRKLKQTFVEPFRHHHH